MPNQSAIPHRMQVARPRFLAINTAIGFTEHLHQNIVAAAADTQRVKRLMQIANKVDEKLQCDRTIGAIERRIFHSLFPIGDAIDHAIAPAIAPRSHGGARLAGAITIAIVSGGVWRDVQVVPQRCLLLIAGNTVGPTRHIGEGLAVEQPLDVLARHRRQAIGGNQSDESMPLPAPGGDRGRSRTPREHRDRQNQLPHIRPSAVIVTIWPFKPAKWRASSLTAIGVTWPISRATIRPSSRMASGSCSTIAAGAWPPCTSSSRIAAADEEPIVAGTKSACPAMARPYSGWRGSAIADVLGLTPPQKLIGAVSVSAGASTAGPSSSTSPCTLMRASRSPAGQPRRSPRNRPATHTTPRSPCS